MSERDELKKRISQLEAEDATLTATNHRLNKHFLDACQRNTMLERQLDSGAVGERGHACTAIDGGML